MIKMERNLPLKVPKLEALLRRLPQNHPKRKEITIELEISKAGHRGEESIDYYLSLLSDERYLIFHNIRLPYKEYYFQIDTLLLSPSFILILEVKNYSGELFFSDTFKQLIRRNEHKDEVFQNPIAQVERQKHQLLNWLENHNFDGTPVEGLVVFSHPKAYLTTSPNNFQVLRKATHSTNLHPIIESFEKNYKEKLLTTKDLRKLTRLLKNETEPLDPNILYRYKIASDHLLKGVYCQSCTTVSMERKAGSWVCMSCGCKDSNAHLISLKDYYFLYGSKITNKSLCDFLNLSSRNIASKLLHSMNLRKTGSTKGTIYELNFEEEGKYTK